MGGNVDDNTVIASANISDEIIDSNLTTGGQAGAELEIKINFSSFTLSNHGEAYLCQSVKNGGALDSDGFIYLDGERITIPKGTIWTDGNTTGASAGYIVFDTTLSAKFNMDGPADSNYVFAVNEGGQWRYDDNQNLIDFTPDSTDVIIGTMVVGSGETITSAGAWVYAKPALDILQQKYTINGAFTDGLTPASIVEDFETAGGGSIDYIEGRWHLNAGHPETATGTLNEDDLRGALKFSSKVSKRDRFNAVKGTLFCAGKQLAKV